VCGGGHDEARPGPLLKANPEVALVAALPRNIILSAKRPPEA